MPLAVVLVAFVVACSTVAAANVRSMLVRDGARGVVKRYVTRSSLQVPAAAVPAVLGVEGGTPLSIL
jgi:hypothetical protein